MAETQLSISTERREHEDCLCVKRCTAKCVYAGRWHNHAEVCAFHPYTVTDF